MAEENFLDELPDFLDKQSKSGYYFLYLPADSVCDETKTDELLRILVLIRCL